MMRNTCICTVCRNSGKFICKEITCPGCKMNSEAPVVQCEEFQPSKLAMLGFTEEEVAKIRTCGLVRDFLV